MVVSLNPDFTLQVQEGRLQYVAGKKQLRELYLEYRMLYPAKLRVEMDWKPFFTDHKKLAQFVKRRVAGSGDRGSEDTDS
ncbi:hypothetical protein NDU88_002478 [Pleurodeles waltl]|uniref:Uncharacterized protein n=1 Tax=Pleurodeles waltl TaxID=8319 RepID=A0AAV7LG19_PLEWA|nr:hypothetical protein NDU88_002478 [Pleurodeles waltl]